MGKQLYSSGHKYAHTDNKQRLATVKQQLQNFENELFQHELNLSRQLALPDDTPGREEQIETAQGAIEIISRSLDTTMAIYDELGGNKKSDKGDKDSE